MEDGAMVEKFGASHSGKVDQDNHGRLVKRWIEGRVLPNSKGDGTINQADIEKTFTDLTPHEKTDLLYEKLMAHFLTARIIRDEKQKTPDATFESPEPVDPYLVAEIRVLWQDKKVQDLAMSGYGEARVDTKLFRQSELGKEWRSINELIDQTRRVFEKETQRLFLQKVTRQDQLSAATGRTHGLAREMIRLQQERQNIVSLKDKPKTRENTDVAAEIMFEQLGTYKDQAEKGFVWLPSRETIHRETVESLQNGRWPVLRGETGTGKSEQADAAAVVLTGEQPTHLACGSNTSAIQLIADRDIDPQTKGGYEIYGPAMQAATGYKDSRETQPSYATGRIVRLDESGRLGPKGYSEIKELRQKRPVTPNDLQRYKEGKSIEQGKLLHGKPVLPGFAAILTTNPEGSRYPDRNEPDAAFRRELSYISVDYPPMTKDNPELYEFMLATLMDQNKHIPVAREELEPSYVRQEIKDGKMLPDGRRVIGEDVLVSDDANPNHGVLYRLSFAMRSLQDAFVHSNAPIIPENSLRYTIDADGKTKIVQQGGDPLTLSSTTITLGDIASWMRGFRERRLKDNPEYQVGTLTEWIKLKINKYLEQVDVDDRKKVRVLFDHYHLFDSSPNLSNAKPITPKQIGYLSPRVPRPLYTTELPINKDIGTKNIENKTESPTRTLETYKDIKVMLEDGSTLVIAPTSIKLNMKEQK